MMRLEMNLLLYLVGFDVIVGRHEIGYETHHHIRLAFSRFVIFLKIKHLFISEVRLGLP